MSEVGKTQLRGHGLLDEGAVVFDERGEKFTDYWTAATSSAHAKCRCGVLSPAGVSKNAAKKWHREHKQSIRMTAAPTGPDPRTDAAEVKTAPCGCRYVGNAGLRDVVMLEKCERHRRPRTDAAVER